MYSFLGNRDEDGDYSEVYYNCDIVNGRVLDQGSSTDPEVKFNETRDSPIIKNASKYDFSIVRFTMDGAGKDLPIWIPVIEKGTAQNDRDLTVYKITLRVRVDTGAGVVIYQSTKPLMFEAEDKGAELPHAPSNNGGVQDLTGRYYYVSSYESVVSMVNTTFESCWTDLNTQYNTATGNNLSSHVPIMSYDSQTNLFTISCDNWGWGSNSFGGDSLDTPLMVGQNNTTSNSLGATITENWDMFFNSNMYGLFSNFKMKYWGGDVETDNRTYQILTLYPTISNNNKFGGSLIDADLHRIYDQTGTRLQINYAGGIGLKDIELITFTQDYPSNATLWSPIQSIVFTTTLIPVLNEFVGQPQKFGDSNDASSSTTQNAFQPIITDIALPLSKSSDYRGFLEYSPQAEYRMIGLTSSNQEIKNIDIQVFWKNRLDGTLVPVRMFNLSSISVKMLFRRKDRNY